MKPVPLWIIASGLRLSRQVAMALRVSRLVVSDREVAFTSRERAAPGVAPDSGVTSTRMCW